MRIDVLTLFPEFIAQAAAVGVVGRAQERGLLTLQGWNPRDYAEGGYRRVDDRPFGGGPGMVMMIEPLRACLAAARAADPAPAPVIYLSPQGRPLTQRKVRELAARNAASRARSAFDRLDSSSRSGRRSQVRPSDCWRRQRAMPAWLPERSTSGTSPRSGCWAGWV